MEIIAPKLSLSHFHPRYWLTWFGFFIAWCFSWLPFPILRIAGSGLGLLTMGLLKSRRNVVEANIDYCFPNLGKHKRQQLIRETFKETGMGLIESMMAWWWPDWRARRITEVRGVEHLHAALEKHNGALMLSCHMLHIEMAGRAIGFARPSTGFYRPSKNLVYEYVQYHGRARSNEHLIIKHNLRGLLRALKTKQAIFYLPDQDPGEHNIYFTSFFDAPTMATTNGTSKLTKMTKCAVVPVQTYRSDKGKYIVEFFPQWDDFPSTSEQDDTQRVNQWFEKCIAEHPEQYMWVHRRFKTLPPNTPPIY